jgi:hypothetical protein
VIEVENTKHYLVSSAPKMMLFTKLLLLIHHNKIVLWNEKTKIKINNEYHVNKFESTSELVRGGNVNF